MDGISDDADATSASALRQTRAFTLVDLLVVIGIVAVLLALLLPALKKVRESANVVACSSNVRQIVLLLCTYAQGNDDRLPYRSLGLQDWSATLAPTGGGRPLFHCPVDDNPRRATPGVDAIRSYGVNSGPFLPDGSPTNFRAPWPVAADALPARLSKVPNHVFLVATTTASSSRARRTSASPRPRRSMASPGETIGSSSAAEIITGSATLTWNIG